METLQRRTHSLGCSARACALAHALRCLIQPCMTYLRLWWRFRHSPHRPHRIRCGSRFLHQGSSRRNCFRSASFLFLRRCFLSPLSSTSDTLSVLSPVVPLFSTFRKSGKGAWWQLTGLVRRHRPRMCVEYQGTEKLRQILVPLTRHWQSRVVSG